MRKSEVAGSGSGECLGRMALRIFLSLRAGPGEAEPVLPAGEGLSRERFPDERRRSCFRLNGLLGWWCPSSPDAVVLPPVVIVVLLPRSGVDRPELVLGGLDDWALVIVSGVGRRWTSGRC